MTPGDLLGIDSGDRAPWDAHDSGQIAFSREAEAEACARRETSERLNTVSTTCTFSGRTCDVTLTDGYGPTLSAVTLR